MSGFALDAGVTQNTSVIQGAEACPKSTYKKDLIGNEESQGRERDKREERPCLGADLAVFNNCNNYQCTMEVTPGTISLHPSEL